MQRALQGLSGDIGMSTVNREQHKWEELREAKAAKAALKSLGKKKG